MQIDRPKTILPFSPEEDFFYGMPNRQKELISLTKEQIESQNRLLSQLSSSMLDSTGIISAELRQQSEILKSSISEAGDRVIRSFEEFGDRICEDLSEIRWVLEQVRSISEQTLAVLKRPRGTEARELVRQGVRNFANGKYQEAETRFRRAWDLDNTDYQVLLNLGYIALHNSRFLEAVDFANDAITLPENVDNQSKAEALWFISRVHYKQKKYDLALHHALESLNYFEDPKRVFKAGVYSALANETKWKELIERAILLDCFLFSAAAIEPPSSTVPARVRPIFLRDPL